ncbi:Nucleotide-binding universal stress protein, UspA family [Streptomyces sp. WMMB 714]|uniref:universal stress protein n=1 Tax=Streptomyces sp. WMMB 714 TaxID=1286822 RepID=UPI0005F78BBC|nr:universal stress protein [Streptomyces sp. WMMB 714]SCK11372.1 Nucleotide-binding universal stress protein, UspA family [Streptomyces sp. WMMB 714]
MEERSVVVGVDGSLESLTAAEWGAAEAASRRVTLRLVCVSQAQSVREEWPVRLEEDGGSHPQARQVLAEARRRAVSGRPGIRVTEDLVAGSAVRSLLKAAGDTGLLVLGSRGLGPVAGFVVGSVGISVIAHARTPVVSVRRQDRTAIDDAPVVVGLDLEHGCAPVLDFAFETAARRGAVLRVAHAWSQRSLYGYPSALPDSSGVDAADGEVHSHYRRVLHPWRRRYSAVAVEEHPARADAAPHLLRLAADASLLVVGRRTRGHPFPTRIGPVTHAVLHHVACPVAVVPHE